MGDLASTARKLYPTMGFGKERPGKLALKDNGDTSKLPAGARPFMPGEFLTNPDNSWSNEVTVTVTNPALNGGQPTVVPSLWVRNGKAVQLSPEEAAKAAVESGLKFKSFSSAEDAKKFTDAREKAWQTIEPQNAGTVAPLWSK